MRNTEHTRFVRTSDHADITDNQWRTQSIQGLWEQRIMQRLLTTDEEHRTYKVCENIGSSRDNWQQVRNTEHTRFVRTSDHADITDNQWRTQSIQGLWEQRIMQRLLTTDEEHRTYKVCENIGSSRDNWQPVRNTEHTRFVRTSDHAEITDNQCGTQNIQGLWEQRIM